MAKAGPACDLNPHNSNAAIPKCLFCISTCKSTCTTWKSCKNSGESSGKKQNSKWAGKTLFSLKNKEQGHRNWQGSDWLSSSQANTCTFANRFAKMTLLQWFPQSSNLCFASWFLGSIYAAFPTCNCLRRIKYIPEFCSNCAGCWDHVIRISRDPPDEKPWRIRKKTAKMIPRSELVKVDLN